MHNFLLKKSKNEESFLRLFVFPLVNFSESNFLKSEISSVLEYMNKECMRIGRFYFDVAQIGKRYKYQC